MFWKCKHPFNRLGVQREATSVPSPKYPEDYNHVTYHLFCQKCGEKLDITYAQMIGGVDGFLARGGAKATPFAEYDDWKRVPTKFNGIDGNEVFVNDKGDIKFVNARGKVDMQTIESVTARMKQSDIQASPELMQTCEDTIRFATDCLATAYIRD